MQQNRERNFHPNAPHQAVISIQVEVGEQSAIGTLKNPPVLIVSKLLTFCGNTFEECHQKLERFLTKTIQISNENEVNDAIDKT